MKTVQVLETVQSVQKGANIVLEWTRPAKVKKTCSDTILKKVRMVGRIGVEYDNLNAVQVKRESGELPSENAGLPWGKYLIYPYLIVHNGKEYLRLYKGTSPLVHASVQWLKNGEKVDRESLSMSLLASEKSESEGDCFCVPIDCITRIHREVMAVEQEVETVEAAAETVEA